MPRRRRQRFRSVYRVTAGLLAAGALAAGVVYFQQRTAPNPDEHLQRAQDFYAHEQPRAAVIELKNVLQSEPENLQARWLLARVYLSLGDGVSAEKELAVARTLGKADEQHARAMLQALLLQRRYGEVLGRAAGLDLDAANAELNLIVAQAQLGLGEFELARAGFKHVLILQPDNVDARLGLSAVALALEQPAEAEQQINIALASASEDPDSWVLKGELLVKNNVLGEAQAAYLEALRHEPTHLLARIGLARVLLLQNKPQEALEHIEFIRQANPHNPVSNYLSAVAARQQNDLAATRTALLDVLKVSPTHPASLLLMGSLHYSSNELEQAHELLVRYVEVEPDNIPGAKLLGAVHLKRGSPPDAVETLGRVLHKAPEDPQLLALLGAAHMANREFDLAHQYMLKAAELQPDAAAIRTQLAISHLLAGDAEKSVEQLEAAVELNPDFHRADYLLCLLHLQQQRFDAALQTATELVSNQPDNPIPLNLLAAAHEGLGDIEAARASYNHAVELQPGYVTAHLNLARLDLIDNNTQAAKTRYLAVLKSEPEHLLALLAVAQLADTEGDRTTAVVMLERARQAHPDAHAPRLVLSRHYLSERQVEAASTVAAEAEALAPDDTATLYEMARIQIALGHFGEAKSRLERVVAASPEAPEAHYYLGVSLGSIGERKAARESFQRTLDLVPDYSPARSALARIAVADGDIDTALEVAAALQREQPNQAEGYVLEADARLAADDLAGARLAYGRALVHQPSQALVLKLAAIEQHYGNPQGAVDVLEHWLDIQPGDQAVRLALASLHQSSGDAAQAATLYERIIAAEPDNVVALNNLAWLYHADDDARALPTAKFAYELLPDRAEITDTYGWILLESGQVEQGLQLIERALQRAPHNGDIRFHYAAGLARTGDKAQAVNELQTLLANDEVFALRAEAEALLHKLKQPSS